MMYQLLMKWVSRKILLAPFMTLLLVFALESCRSVKYIPIIETRDSIIVSPIDTIILPPDSGVIKALLECDENGKVIMSNLEAINGENINMKLQLDSLGNLLAKAEKDSSTHLKPQNPIIIEREKKIPYPVEKELTKWQQIKMDVGGYAIIIGCLIIIFFIGRFFFRLRR